MRLTAGESHFRELVPRAADAPEATVSRVRPGGTSLSAVQAIQNTAFPLTFGSAAGALAPYDELAPYDQALSRQDVSDHPNAGDA